MSLGPVTSRLATNADIPDLCALINSAYRGEVSRKGWTTEADFLDGQRIDNEALVDLIAEPGSVILLFFAQGSLLVGSVLLRKKSDCAYLGMLTVKPELQAAGLGRTILETSERWTRSEWKLPKIEMRVINHRPELIAWYERRGYSNSGRREPFPYGDDRFGIPKRDDLEFIILEKTLSR